MIGIGVVGSRIVGKYKILRVRPIGNSLDNVTYSRFESNMKIQQQAEVIFDSETKSFIKNRYNNDTTIQRFPTSLKKVYTPILDIMKKGSPYENLISKYSKMNLVEAIYLSDTYKDFYDKIDPIEYQMIRFKYGKEVLKDFILKLVERYPEKLI